MQARLRIRDLFRTVAAISPAVLLLGLVASSGVATAQSVTPSIAGFWVQSHGESLRLEVRKASSLSEILGAMCKEAKVECAGERLVSNDSVPAMAVEGRFLEVVKNLLDGTEVNFEYAHSTTGSKAKLVLLRRTDIGSVMQQTANVPRVDLVPNATKPMPLTPPVIDQTVDIQVPSSPEASPSEAGPTQLPSENAVAQKAAEMMFAGGYASVATPSAFLPFPGPDGKPIPAKPVDAEFLPFPDQFGNPIPVAPVKPGSPFPVPSESKTHN